MRAMPSMALGLLLFLIFSWRSSALILSQFPGLGRSIAPVSSGKTCGCLLCIFAVIASAMSEKANFPSS